MSPNDMPRFDFSGCSIKTDEELEKTLAEDKKKGRFNQGKHGVVIKAVKWDGLCKKDDTWGQIVFTYEGTGEKEISDLIQIPFKDITYGSSKTTFPFRKLTEFCAGLGVQLKATNLQTVMQSTFSKPEKLVGTALDIDVGYRKAYARFVRKNGDIVLYSLILSDGAAYQENGIIKLFEGYKAVEEFANNSKIEFDKNINVTRYYPGQAKKDETPF